MNLVRTRFPYAIVSSAIMLASCGGGALHQIPASTQSDSAHSPAGPATSALPLNAAANTTYALPLSDGYSGTISLRVEHAPAKTKLLVRVEQSRGGAAARAATASRSGACPAPPTILLENPFPFPITIRLTSFTIHVPCSVDGALFGVSFYQTVPQPNVVTSTKLGNARASGNTVTFTPAVATLTFAPLTTSALAVRQETSTAEVVLPVAPGSTTVLTSNASNVPSSLSFNYTTAAGGSSYSAACFDAYDKSGALMPALRGAAIAGTPSFYCSLDPGASTITFGQLVKFFIGAPKTDASVFEFDGPGSAYLCTDGDTTQCDTPAFSIPTYRNLIVANAKDLRLCVPVKDSTDCNNVGGKAWPPPSTHTVSRHRDFQLLVADDPTYRPGTALAPVPWDGLLRLSVSGQCRLNTHNDNDNGDVPPGYSDDDQAGVGPYAEFDITPTGAGFCDITTSEDPKFITNYSDPQHPMPRSKSLLITILR